MISLSPFLKKLKKNALVWHLGLGDGVGRGEVPGFQPPGISLKCSSLCVSELSVLLRSPDPMTFCVQRFKFPGKVLDWLCYSPDATAPSLGASRGNVG